MEELAVIAAGAVAVGLALFVADLVGLMLGLGWGHYSKRLAAKRKMENPNSDD